MSVEDEVRAVLGNVLQLGERARGLSRSSGLLGTLPELDSMAVVGLIGELESQFGIQLAATDGARLFAVHWPAAAPSLRQAVLVLPPFAEELNKCRPMLAAQARALAAAGLDVLLVDLFGTGDSDGEFVEARWERWQQD